MRIVCVSFTLKSVSLRTEIERSFQDKFDKLNLEKDIVENKVKRRRRLEIYKPIISRESPFLRKKKQY